MADDELSQDDSNPVVVTSNLYVAVKLICDMTASAPPPSSSVLLLVLYDSDIASCIVSLEGPQESIPYLGANDVRLNFSDLLEHACILPKSCYDFSYPTITLSH